MQHRVIPDVFAQLRQQFGIFGELFHQDLPRSIQRRFHIRDAAFGIDEGSGDDFRDLRRIVQQPVSERR